MVDCGGLSRHCRGRQKAYALKTLRSRPMSSRCLADQSRQSKKLLVGAYESNRTSPAVPTVIGQHRGLVVVTPSVWLDSSLKLHGHDAPTISAEPNPGSVQETIYIILSPANRLS